ncbi:MAG: phenylalanine--tRNA ligase subunit beta, partial [Acidobacteria bacterium]|nr:phenylalanine--tRNA ligase subunit beta [Acidobacteriota bacterium]
VGLAVEGIEPHGDDLILDIDLTSNRPDCLSHLGVARELGVITGKPLTAETRRRGEADADLSETEVETDAVPFPAVLAPEIVRIEAPELCSRFTARIIRNVKIGPSPEWLVKRLEALGERSINNVADITNYVMLELGQPMHAFDLDKLKEHRIVVRTAKTGESIKTLDEVERNLDETMLAICDGEKPIAVAGVMGGFDSGITESTTNVLLEVAYFKRESIRQTSRKLNLATEASYRFERGVDIENVINASDRATDLILQLAGGEAADIIDIYPNHFQANVINSRDISGAVKRLTGLEVASEQCDDILERLGIASDTAEDGSVVYKSPSWRHDIAIEEDLVEEIARHYGYEKIADELPPAYGAGEYQPAEGRKKALRRALSGLGFDEAITYSFIDTKHDDSYDSVPEFNDTGRIELRDSVIEGAVRMRPTLLPGLLDAVRLNLNHQRRSIKLFELGKVFAHSGSEGELPLERETLGLIVTGGEMNEDRSLPVRQTDFYDIKGSLESALEALGAANAEFSALNVRHMVPGQSAAIAIDNKIIGSIGRLSEEIAANYKFKQPIYVGEIDLQAVLEKGPQPVSYSALPKYPSVLRDLTLLVTNTVTFDQVRNTVAAAEQTAFRDVKYVDLYEAKGEQAGERSLTVRLEFRSEDRTLTDEEVDSAFANILEKLKAVLDISPKT